MPRPRQFDPEAVLDAAQRVFQLRGYEGASVQHLTAATGLSRSSLYGAFGDKHALFLAVLDRYAAAGKEASDAACCGPSPVEAIRAVLAQAAVPGDVPGCLMVAAATERAALDPATAARTDTARRGLVTRFETLVRDAQAADEIDAARDPAAVAAMLTGAVFGLRVLQTTGADADALAAVVDETMAGLAR